jgi:hypothetical protein
MSITQPYSSQAWNDGRGGIRGVIRRPRIGTREHSGVVPAMGPANRAPGIAIMGAPSDPRFVDSLFAGAAAER